MRLGEDGRAVARPGEEAMDGRPAPVLDDEAGIEESCRNSDGVALIEPDAPISGIRLSDSLYRNAHGWAPAAPVEGAGSALAVDLLKQRPAKRAQVGVARLEEPLTERALQRDSVRFADRCRLDAAWRDMDAGHDKPPRKRLALAEHIFIHSGVALSFARVQSARWASADCCCLLGSPIALRNTCFSHGAALPP